MDISPYAVGALLYAPANQQNLARRVISGNIPSPYSLALCLEDSISDAAVPQAEEQVLYTLEDIAAAKADFYHPLVFIRVRDPKQIESLYTRLHAGRAVLTGFIAPKCTVENAPDYLSAVARVNRRQDKPLYLMPILESPDLAEPDQRPARLRQLKTLFDAQRDQILNVRVGGNDFCHLFGLRRRVDESIHEIGCVAHILTDILACFSRDYVVSGPVWEYFSDARDDWRRGMLRETKRDFLNGFIGKTVIHPNQIPVVNEVLRVRREDYDDARQILNMASNTRVLVVKSAAGGRMNEYKTHTRWAHKICTLAEIYGVQP